MPPNEEFLPVGYYYVLPHHAVFKDSTTTKCRAVFNASAKTSNGNSLNDCLLIGPKQQPDLYSILVRFRFLNVALTGDVTKMYRQVILNEKDRNIHQNYWRSDPSKPIKKWRLTRVKYGVASSSYHAIRALRDSVVNAPNQICKESILESFYVDDYVGGAAPEITTRLTSTLASVGMQIRKWAKSSKAVMAAIPPELRENKEISFYEHDQNLKTLGLLWAPEKDCFRYEI